MSDPLFYDEMTLPSSEKIQKMSINNTNTTGTMGISTNTMPFSWYPYGYYNYTPTPRVSINKVDNGFIVQKDGKTLIAKTVEEIVNLLKESK